MTGLVIFYAFARGALRALFGCPLPEPPAVSYWKVWFVTFDDAGQAA
jgi:hypothetical protein